MASAETASPHALRLVDLRDEPPARREALLRAFEAEIYAPAFPDIDIREDPRVWLKAMAEKPAPPWPVVAPILALDGEDRVRGGVVLERYRNANAGFLTYLVVAPQLRSAGLGRLLSQAAIRILREESPPDSPAPILFAEAERPDLIDDPHEQQRARQRLGILAALGALVGEIDYVQPPLAPGLAPHRLYLLAAAESLPESRIAPGWRVLAFLEELYRALACDPKTSESFAAMAAEIARLRDVRFKPI